MLNVRIFSAFIGIPGELFAGAHIAIFTMFIKLKAKYLRTLKMF